MSEYYFAVAGTTTGVDSFKRIYVFSGDRPWWDNGEINFPTQSYDPKNDSWIEGTAMSTGRLEAAVAVVNDIVYVIGGLIPWLGSNWSASAANEQYIPIGYATPNPSYVPTASPSASNQLTQSPQSTAIQAELILAIAGILIAIIIMVAAALNLKRKHKPLDQ